MNETLKKHFLKAMELLDALNELISDIEWDSCEEELDEKSYSLLMQLQYGVEDTESTLSDVVYESEIYDEYFESEVK